MISVVHVSCSLRYSFGIKGKDDKKPDVPAPNAYDVGAIKEAPSYSLTSR